MYIDVLSLPKNQFRGYDYAMVLVEMNMIALKASSSSVWLGFLLVSKRRRARGTSSFCGRPCYTQRVE